MTAWPGVQANLFAQKLSCAREDARKSLGMAANTTWASAEILQLFSRMHLTRISFVELTKA